MASKLETLIRDLRLRRGRERRGLALAEGVRLVEEALAAGIAIRSAAVSPHLESSARGGALKAALAQRGVALTQLDDRALTELADTEHPQGVIAVIEPPSWSWAHLRMAPGTVVLALDAVQDPGNVGTIVRTAHSLGAAGVVALKGTAELHNPKVLRATMGASFRLPAFSAAEEELLTWLADHQVEPWVATTEGMPVNRLPAGPAARPPVCLILGNEGAGVSPGLAERAGQRIAIPLAAGAESLNVAVAAGILLYEVLRER
jgi:RNA methyltransferase, TrmH family